MAIKRQVRMGSTQNSHPQNIQENRTKPKKASFFGRLLERIKRKETNDLEERLRWLKKIAMHHTNSEDRLGAIEDIVDRKTLKYISTYCRYGDTRHAATEKLKSLRRG